MFLHAHTNTNRDNDSVLFQRTAAVMLNQISEFCSKQIQWGFLEIREKRDYPFPENVTQIVI